VLDDAAQFYQNSRFSFYNKIISHRTIGAIIRPDNICCRFAITNIFFTVKTNRSRSAYSYCAECSIFNKRSALHTSAFNNDEKAFGNSEVSKEDYCEVRMCNILILRFFKNANSISCTEFFCYWEFLLIVFYL
jgi:hypothetical protein